MPKKHLRILAIDPGTRFMGVAFTDNGKLVYHGVKVINRGLSPHESLAKARKVVLRLIKDYQPNVLAVERVFFANNKNASLLKVLFEEIRTIAKRKRLKLVSFAPSSLKKFICGNGWANKYEVARAVVQRYPELRVYLTQDRAWKERFHHNMFDAVALAIMVLDSGLR
jgi:crossover junction endodeoxyribonuclease RuvC